MKVMKLTDIKRNEGKTNMKKRLFGILLCFTIVLTLLTTAVLAAATDVNDTGTGVGFGVGGSNNASAHPDQNGKLVSPPTPVRNNYTFDGWYTAASGENKITEDTVFSTDTTVYAHWTAVAETAVKDRITNPKAGDDSGIALWMGLMAVNLLAAFFTWRHGHKQNQHRRRERN